MSRKYNGIRCEARQLDYGHAQRGRIPLVGQVLGHKQVASELREMRRCSLPCLDRKQEPRTIGPDRALEGPAKLITDRAADVQCRND